MDLLTRCAFLISLYSGLRMGEVVRLTRADVDLTHGKFLLGETKAGKRQVSQMNEVSREAALQALATHDHEFLYPSPTALGAHISRRSLHDRLIKALKAAGIEVKPSCEGGLTWHSTRHTFVTRLTENGVNIGTVKELARHSTITMTNEYIRAVDDSQKRALDGLCVNTNVSELFPEPRSRGGHLREVSS